MPKRRLILGILALGILAALIFALTRPREPSYQGHTLSYWLERLTTWEHSLVAQREGYDAIHHMGTKAIPYLMNFIRCEEPQEKTKLLETVGSILRNVGINGVTSASTKAENATWALISLGPAAKSTIPELVRLLNEPKAPHTARRAAEALTHIGGKEIVPALAAVLTNHQHPARWSVALNIQNMGNNAHVAIPALIKSLSDPEPLVRKAATNTLRKIAPEALTNALP